MDQTTDIKILNEKIERESAFVDIIRMEMNKVIVGQKHLVESLMTGLLGNGHILLEGVPGLAKTLAIKSLASIIDAKFSRIQFTPDLLPADLIGTMIYSQKKEEFLVKKGPVFANFILADEINRSPAKVQSALLEAMQERQVTIGESTFSLGEPFLVLATQNPIEQEGTYPLPEAQVDRFMLKVIIDYPSMEEYMDEKIENYILNIVFASRNPEKYGLPAFKNMISYGASPRASIYLSIAAKSYAFIRRRGYVIPEDVRAVCFDVMRHRIGLTYEAEAENVNQDKIIAEILNVVEVP